MTKSKTQDAQLKASIASNEAKRAKYQRVRDAIASHSLDFQRSLALIDSFIDTAKNALDKLGSNGGYTSYLSTFQEKLTADKQVLENYRNYVRNANTYFMNLADTLDASISSLDAVIRSEKAAFNEGHTPFVDDYYLW